MDSSDPSKWNDTVLNPAIEVVEAFINNKNVENCKLKPVLLTSKAYSDEESRQNFHCDLCNLVIKGKLSFQNHLKGRRHKFNLKKNVATEVNFIEKGCEDTPSKSCEGQDKK